MISSSEISIESRDFSRLLRCHTRANLSPPIEESLLDIRQKPIPFSRSFRGFFPAVMKDAVAIDRVNNCHQDSIRFGLDQQKTAFEPLRAVPLLPASVNGTATNGFHSANMADADDIAVRTALAKLSVEEQVSRLLALLFAVSVGLARCASRAPGASNIRPACSVRSVFMHAQCSIPPCPAPRRVLLRAGETKIIRGMHMRVFWLDFC